MFAQSNTWALVLAAGEGTRLRSLTTVASGTTVPKQFCSLYEGPSLLHEALCRARTVAAEDRICVIVAEQHRRWWEGALWTVPLRNVIVQPENRGTGLGILLPLLHILSRNPEARIVLLPSDHHVREESVLTSAIQDALEQLQRRRSQILLLGIRPQELDPDLGYIVPGLSDGRGAFTVERFVEKPSLVLASDLIRAGALWNTFIVASTGLALLKLYRDRFPEIVSLMMSAFEADHRAVSDGIAMAEVYEQLPAVDFSRDILAGPLADLRVLPVPPCGWSDLGTPKRVAEALRRTPRPVEAPARLSVGYLSLADQHVRVRLAQGAGGAI